MKKKAAGRTKNQFGKNEVRKRAAVMNLTWLVVWLLSFAGMAVFYELKCQAVIGAVYQSNPSAGILVTNHMFMAKINYENLISARITCQPQNSLFRVTAFINRRCRRNEIFIIYLFHKHMIGD